MKSLALLHCQLVKIRQVLRSFRGIHHVFVFFAQIHYLVYYQLVSGCVYLHIPEGFPIDLDLGDEREVFLICLL